MKFELLIISMLILDFGCIFTIGLMLVQVKSDQNHFKNQFKSLTRDFKSQTEKLQKGGVLE